MPQGSSAVRPTNGLYPFLYIIITKTKKYDPSWIKCYEHPKREQEAKIRTHLDTMSEIPTIPIS